MIFSFIADIEMKKPMPGPGEYQVV